MTKRVPSDVPPASVSGTIRMLEGIKRGDHGDPAETCIVSFSGGKDSWTILDMACRVWGPANVNCYNLYIVPGMECELQEFRKVERRYGIHIRRIPHPGLQAALRAGHLQPVPTSFRRKLQHADIYEYVRNITSSDWVIFGHRMDESLQRRGMIRRDRGVITHLRKVYPLWNWTAPDVYHYIKSAKIPAPEQYTESDTTGFTLAPNSLLYLRSKYPDDYKKVIEMFPFAEVQLLREAQRMQAGLDPTVVSITQKPGLLETLNEYMQGIMNDDHEYDEIKRKEKPVRAAKKPAR